MISIDEIKFDEKGLVPAVVQDAATKRVLTVAYMNRESLEKTIETGETVFWSRSRQELWHKGETSGNYQHVVSIIADCDRDALTVLVNKDGPACHLGTDSCFEYPLVGAVDRPGESSVNPEYVPYLYDLLQDRKKKMPEGSYTSYLFDKGIDKILKKVGEESTEVIIAAKADDRKETIYEIADLTYHVLVMMVQMGISVDEVLAELESRHIIDHKVKQEHMTK
ncbi:MAG: bifunctional phosphoribosyl-AMP cyclohydrolase/phosphoribosyl-ATP diphosphatase HisIE [Anaerovoracaceae bacterium]|jgi:phosphoribosyl-ATP pyrophosphohydrolase/phosphoribosyl-AMP cyclohydrolase